MKWKTDFKSCKNKFDLYRYVAAIGKQWESWTPTEDGPYVDVIARARTFATMPDIMAYFRAGYIRGGTEHCALIANGDKFWNPPMVLPNENARHKLLDLVGDLSLLAEPGGAVQAECSWHDT
jgi:UDP-3-O-[3-hydroxymyristoyl] N-acetylglucosamine deacetylase